MARPQVKASRVKNDRKKDSSSDDTGTSTDNDKKQPLREFWGSIKRATNLKKRSLPDIFRRNDKVPNPLPSRKRSQRAEDIAEAAFGDALIGLMKRNERSRKLLCDSTLKEFEREKRQVHCRRNSD
ncbi:hypothetical protein MMC11_006045 [Xylographa trunciseda]|nr:hypothetical protein [Xylographa trunciseda]